MMSSEGNDKTRIGRCQTQSEKITFRIAKSEIAESIETMYSPALSFQGFFKVLKLSAFKIFPLTSHQNFDPKYSKKLNFSKFWIRIMPIIESLR